MCAAGDVLHCTFWHITGSAVGNRRNTVVFFKIIPLGYQVNHNRESEWDDLVDDERMEVGKYGRN
jgi:hypothetical protein